MCLPLRQTERKSSSENKKCCHQEVPNHPGENSTDVTLNLLSVQSDDDHCLEHICRLQGTSPEPAPKETLGLYQPDGLAKVRVFQEDEQGEIHELLAEFAVGAGARRV